MALNFNGMSTETDEQLKLRFQIELEFVQCLANPNYLHFLAQRGYFKETTFINYLSYLMYWQEPEYSRFLKYPMCLHFLELLQYEHFRREIISQQCCKFIDDQSILLWQQYTRRRTRLLQQNGILAMDAPSASTAATVKPEPTQNGGSNVSTGNNAGTSGINVSAGVNGVGSGSAAGNNGTGASGGSSVASTNGGLISDIKSE